jgi:hypothetical protein
MARPTLLILGYAVLSDGRRIAGEKQSHMTVDVAQSQPNPPTFGSGVRVFGPGDNMDEIQGAVNAAYANNGGHDPPDHGHWSEHRYAFLFKPGTYNVEVPVGYYTQVAGLGTSPDDVVFTSPKGVYCEEGTFKTKIGALNTFWRSVENFRTSATYDWIPGRGEGMTWAASQASPMRRLHVDNNLILYEYRQGEWNGDYASGGFLGNSKIEGIVASGSQQQFFTRNSEMQQWQDGVWNMVFMGVQGAPASHCGSDASMCSSSFLTLPDVPTVAEKPFVSIDSSGRYSLNVPGVKSSSAGVDWDPGRQIDFSQVYVADPARDTAATINAHTSAGLSVVLSAGLYHLEAPIELNHANQVLLGLGLANLIAAHGTSAIVVGNVPGVRIGGILVSAGPEATDVLVKFGSGGYSGEASNPGTLQDVFIRVGDQTASGVQARVMLEINNGHTIGDNVWLWRADHTAEGLVYAGNNPCDHGLVVNGDDVTMLGWSAEHSLKDQVQWNGERGYSSFLQVELPYDVDSSYGDAGITGYRVADNVQQHTAYGVGIYHYFRDFAVTVETGVVAPAHLTNQFIQPFSVYLNGSGTMNHIINDQGPGTYRIEENQGEANPKWMCNMGSSFIQTESETGCAVGDNVVDGCGSGIGCAGNSCCPDGRTCPSAHPDFACCPAPKVTDCTGGVAPPPAPPPAPAPAPVRPVPSPTPTPTPAPPAPAPAGGGGCPVNGDAVCPDGNHCAGSQCCMDGSTCPSAPASFNACFLPKATDCTR